MGIVASILGAKVLVQVIVVGLLSLLVAFSWSNLRAVHRRAHPTAVPRKKRPFTLEDLFFCFMGAAALFSLAVPLTLQLLQSPSDLNSAAAQVIHSANALPAPAGVTAIEQEAKKVASGVAPDGFNLGIRSQRVTSTDGWFSIGLEGKPMLDCVHYASATKRWSYATGACPTS